MQIKNLRLHAAAQVNMYLLAFPGEQAHVRQLRGQLEDDLADVFHRSNMRGHITTSALVIDPIADKVLVIHHGAYDRWLQPGGHQEGDGPLAASAAREAEEETGVSAILSQWHGGGDVPFDIDTHPIAANPKKGEGDHFHHDFIYLFSADSKSSLKPQLSEVKAAKWISREEFAALPGARFARLGAKLADLRAELDLRSGRALAPT